MHIFPSWIGEGKSKPFAGTLSNPKMYQAQELGKWRSNQKVKGETSELRGEFAATLDLLGSNMPLRDARDLSSGGHLCCRCVFAA